MTTKDMLPLLLGSLLLGALASCRADKPPEISRICILDGFGGGDCVLFDGTKQYMAPSEMKNMWATTQVDETNIMSWCYKTTPANAAAAMKVVAEKIK